MYPVPKHQSQSEMEGESLWECVCVGGEWGVWVWHAMYLHPFFWPGDKWNATIEDSSQQKGYKQIGEANRKKRKQLHCCQIAKCCLHWFSTATCIYIYECGYINVYIYAQQQRRQPSIAHIEL